MQTVFWSDYQQGAHSAVLQRLLEGNLEPAPGYGGDHVSERARERIRSACGCPKAAVHFLVGGTQTNAVVIRALLAPYQGVVSADSGHISVHEAGAIEYGGHKVLTVPGRDGKVAAPDLERLCGTYWQDENREHMVMPGMVYLSQPTEFGTLYSRGELEALRQVCDRYRLRLYVDGARLAYALACPENDVSLADLARLCDVFYIGGTKCGALLGEAVVIPDPELLPHFFTIVKRHGALLAKGRVIGAQFDALFEGELYLHIGETAVAGADRIRACLRQAGYEQPIQAPTNQIFVRLSNAQAQRLEKRVGFGFWERTDQDHLVVRFVTSWATTPEDVEALCAALREL